VFRGYFDSLSPHTFLGSSLSIVSTVPIIPLFVVALYASLEICDRVTSMGRWGSSRSAKVGDRGATVDGPIEEWTNVVRIKLFSCDIIPVVTDGRRLGSTMPDVGNEGSQDSSMARSNGSGIRISCDESEILDIGLDQRSQVLNVLYHGFRK
jgi:hypothetical protein